MIDQVGAPVFKTTHRVVPTGFEILFELADWAVSAKKLAELQEFRCNFLKQTSSMDVSGLMPCPASCSSWFAHSVLEA